MTSVIIKVAAVAALTMGVVGVTGQAALAAASTERGHSASAIVVEDSRGIKEIVIKALRKGGPELAQLLAPLSPEAAQWVKDNAARLADFLESHDWTYAEIKGFLVANGCPGPVAHVVAKFLSSIIIR